MNGCFSRHRIACAALIATALTGCSAGAQTVPVRLAQLAPKSIFAATGARKSSYVLYVGVTEGGAVDAYDFKSGELLGSASEGFQFPDGLCGDKKGDVYAVDYNAATITEFAAGTLTVIKTLADSTGYPIGCSVNPKNGDLAVTNNSGIGSSGGVLIYKHASGKPTEYSPCYNEWPAGFDPSGNLFVEGQGGNCGYHVYLEELPYGGSSFEVLSFNQKITDASGVEWDGKYLGVGDEAVDSGAYSGIYETRVSGSTATRVRTVQFDVSGVFYQWANVSAKPNDLPVPRDTRILAAQNDSLYEYAYPAGGKPLGQFTLSAGGIPLASLLVRVK